MYPCDISLLRFITQESSRSVSKMFLCDSVQDLEFLLYNNYGLSKESYYVLCNGKKLNCLESELFNVNNILKVVPRTLGGKGGFGSMLRAIGAQIEKTTNREACRDLSGRRLRDINEEKRLKNWISQQADREREAAERKKKKLERLCQEPRHDFKDEKYDDSRSVMTEEMSSSVDLGFKASTSGGAGVKRKSSETNKPTKKKKKGLLIDSDISDTSEDDTEEEKDESSNKSEISKLS